MKPPATAAASVLVTRPEREAAAWVRALAGRGLQAQALPLIAILPPVDGAALAAARAGLAGRQAVMFVSANAVRGLLGQGEAAPAWPAGVRAWATGPGTCRALRAAGVPEALVDAPADDAAQFDSEALWQRVAGQARPGGSVLVARGGDAAGLPAGRDWLSGRMLDAGLQVDAVVAYRRGLPAWQPAQADRARAAAADGSWWLFSSSEAVGNLARLLPGVPWSAARALCTHPRIAQAAADAGFGRVEQVRPVVDAVAAFLQSQP